MNLKTLKKALVKAGCTSLFVKILAANDNSKNQVYLGGSVEALQMFRPNEIVSNNSKKGPTFKGKLSFSWLQDSGNAVPAPNTQLILYSQYPEVRLSGFLKGCPNPPSNLMTVRQPGRVLFMGVSKDGDVVAYVTNHNTALAKEYIALGVDNDSALNELSLTDYSDQTVSRKKLLDALKKIHENGWVISKQLDSKGIFKPCNNQNCGGLTLEAELGVSKNSRSEADYAGYEVKSYKVSNFEKPFSGGEITLQTPEPTGGDYKKMKLAEWLKKYGYPAKDGTPDRINFSSPHYIDKKNTTTELTLKLKGFDSDTKKITDAEGSLDLVTSSGTLALSWSFSKILEHWSRKHQYAAYVPNQVRVGKTRAYQYGHLVILGSSTNHELFLSGLAAGKIKYDPGLNIKKASSEHPKEKKRNQFRIRATQLPRLYGAMEEVDLNNEY